MKVVLFCGGLGMRIREFSENIPKPMVPIGYRPILWHVMKYYAHFGHKDFILCLGYRSDVVKQYFLDYNECLSNDFVLPGGGNAVEMLGVDIRDWRVTFVDTGVNANLGQRLRAVAPHLKGEETFLANYADGLSDLPLPAQIEHFEKSGKIASFVSIRPTVSYHYVSYEPGGAVTAIGDASMTHIRINGGFFVFRRRIFDYMKDGEELVVEPFQRLIAEQQLVTYPYDGFWMSMDTFKDRQKLEELQVAGNAPWQVWATSKGDSLVKGAHTMKVLVTGSQGYIGAVLTPLIGRAGHEVHGIDTDLYQRCGYAGAMPDIPWIRKDIREVEPADLRGFDAVIHLAALSNDPLGDLNPELTMDINHRASVRLATLAKQAGVKRFLFSSSCSTYGAAGEEMLTEAASFNPVTAYAESKVLVERDVAKLADDAFSPTFLRNATAYGVSPRIRFDLVLNNLVAWAHTTGRIFVKSDGTPWRPIIHIEDISRAFLAVLTAPREKIHNEAFNVGRDEENYRVKELAAFVGETVPGCRIEFASDASPDKRSYRVNFGKFAAAFPNAGLRWTARAGVVELYESYRKANFTREEFEGPRYKRIDHIKSLIASGDLGADLRWTKTDVGRRAT